MVLALVAIAVLAPAGAPGALAASHGPRSRGTRLKRTVAESFSLFGTRGFIVTVTVANRHTLQISTSKLAVGLGIGATGATYTVPYRKPGNSDDIKARIGHIGRIDVRFLPESVKKEPPFLSECHGPKTVIEQGEFVGSIDIRGERDSTRARARHAVGTITKSPALTCKFSANGAQREKAAEKKEAESESQPSESESEGIELKATTADGRVSLKGVRVRLREKPGKGFGLISFEATAQWHLGRVKVSSQATTVFDAGKSFVSPEPPRPTKEALIRPGRPFKGSATFRRTPSGGVTWTGDLRAELPGLGVVRLAGPGTHAAMCEPAHCMGG